MSEYITAKIGGRPHRLLAEDAAFWRRVESGEWEPDTLDALARCLRRGAVFVDAGAWVGATTLFAAARGAHVYCIEPDPAAYERLLANLRLNSVANVHPLHAALGAKNARVPLACARGLGKSMTRVQPAAAPEDAQAWALALTPARFMEWWGIEKIDLLKIDIEGGEFDLAPALAEILPRAKPAIHLSLHAPFFPEKIRREKLAVIAGLAGRYAFCYDGALRGISPEDVLGDEFAGGFRSVVLADRML